MIHKIKNGSWMYRFYLNGKDIRKKGFASKHEAQEAENRKKAELQGIAYNTNNLSLIYENYENKRKMSIKQSTIVKDRGQIKKYILPYFTYVSDITPSKIDKWKSDIVALNLKESTTNQIIKCFKQLLVYASKQAPVPNGSIDNLESIKKHEIKKEMQIWSINEFNTFIASVDNTFYKLLFTTLFYSGLRISELRALTKNDIVDNELVITKRKEAKLKDKGFTTLKTSNSNRRVLMPIYIINDLKALECDGLLFPVSETQIRRMLDKYCTLSKVKHIRLHDFRHSHASFLLNNGCSLRLVSERLGHSSPSITMDYYWHILPNEQQKIIDIIEKEKTTQ